MTNRQIIGLVATLAAVLIGGCAGIPQDGRYQTHDAGRSNTRAEAPVEVFTLPS
jgi:hypothetical protein